MSPYIKPERRERVHVAAGRARTVGELTFQLTELLEKYREDWGDEFGTFAACVAACEQAKDEFQRRVIHPYEDKKRAENGDVYS